MPEQPAYPEPSDSEPADTGAVVVGGGTGVAHNVMPGVAGGVVQAGVLHGGVHLHVAPPPTIAAQRSSDALPPSEGEASSARPPGREPGASTRRTRPTRPVGRLEPAAEELAMSVGIRLRREYEHQQVHDPFPLPVRWAHVVGELSDHVENIHARPIGGRAERVDLDGGFGQVAEVYRRVPTGRLVVLGDAGSGKTMLATRLTLDLLGDREPGQPVPVRVDVASWDPTRTGFRAWLAELLVRDHPGLARTTPGGVALGAALVGTDMVLPVLDGFDEIARGLRGPALRKLNKADLPVVLTSRPAEYENAVAADVLTGAAVIRLGVLSPADLAGYLPRATRSDPGAGSATGTAGTRWHPVIARLTADVPDAGARNVAAALSTPLMVSLARAIYSDTPGRDPADLLDTGRFPAAPDIEDHLLGSFVPSVYDDPADEREQDWRLDQVLRWLGYLARHGATRREPGIAWWGLGTSLPAWSRAVVVGLVSMVSITLVYVVVGGPLSVLIYGGTILDGLWLQLVNGLLTGAVAGPVLGLAHGLMRHLRVITPAPSLIRVRMGRGRPSGAIPLAKVRSRTVTALIGGLGFGAGVGLLAALPSAAVVTPRTGAVLSAVFAAVFGVAAAAAIGVASWFESPADADAAASPGDSLKANRDAVRTQMLLGGLVFGLVTGLCAYAFGDLIIALVVPGAAYTSLGYALGVGVMNWIFGALAYAVTASAWGHWLIVARLWLPLTGRLPWRLRSFLEDAYDRGVLRQSGPVWEFRHERLQRHLAAGRSPDSPARPDSPHENHRK
ncbi:NACHT domain-containing NTPase [Saccharothrix sp. HUAS TT1]|uniref:NACHT domain-containing protein n=1 Tax=unclassified Saccharothrix TaxID=2593673 RepID=UPI00345C0AE1